MNPDQPSRVDMFLRRNKVETYDRFFNPLVIPSHEGFFYKNAKTIKFIVPEQYPDQIFEINIFLDDIETTHIR
jgi:hypothetical protein